MYYIYFLVLQVDFKPYGQELRSMLSTTNLDALSVISTKYYIHLTYQDKK